MFNEKGVRTNPKEVKELIQSQNLIVASQKGKLIGTIVVQKLKEDSTVGAFRMLCVDPQYRGKKIGSLL